MAWDTFNEPFIKAVLIFIVLVNVVRTKRRLMAILWLSIGIGIYLGYNALRLYSEASSPWKIIVLRSTSAASSATRTIWRFIS